MGARAPTEVADGGGRMSGEVAAAAKPAAGSRGPRRALGFWDLVALGVGGIIGSGWLFSVLSAASLTGPSSVLAWALGGGITLLLALAWAELGGLFPKTGTTTRIPYYTHGPFGGFLFGWIRFLAVASIPAIEAEAVVTALSGLFVRYGVPIQLSATRALGGAAFVGLSPAGLGVAALLVLGFLALNLAGISALGSANRWVTVWKLVVPLIAVGVLLSVFRPANIAALPGGALPYGVPALLAAVSSSGIMFAYLGFAQMLDFGGEARRPGRDMPRALLAAVAIAVLVYCSLAAAFLGAVRWAPNGLPPGDWHGLASATWASLPLYYAITANPGTLFVAVGLLLLVDAAVSPTGTGWIYLGTATRSLFGWADQGGIPPSLRTLDARGVPARALAVSTAVALVFLLPLPSWYLLVGFLSSATVLTYVVGSLAVPILRSAAPEASRPFRLPAAAVLAPAGFVAGLLVVYWAGFALIAWLVAITAAGEIAFALLWTGRTSAHSPLFRLGAAGLAVLLGAWIIAGPIGQAVGGPGPGALWSVSDGPLDAATLSMGAVALVAPWAYLWRGTEGPERQAVAAGGWVPGGLVAIYLLSYVGQYGPTSMVNGLAHTLPWARVLPFPWDTLAALAAAVTIYLIARASARPDLGRAELSGRTTPESAAA